jgi:uroporphyrinogen-III synthase
MAMSRRVVVTRPVREGLVLAESLELAGFDPVVLPLIAFGSPIHDDRLRAARSALATYDAVMFVSPQAVHAFLNPEDTSAMGQPGDRSGFEPTMVAIAGSGLRCWAPGPGTANALCQFNVPGSRIDQPASDSPQFDSEALWQSVASQVKPGFRLLVVRGETAPRDPQNSNGKGNGREWLVDRCRAAGADVQVVAAYQRRLPDWSPVQVRMGREAAGNGTIWLFSSSEGVGNLVSLLPGTCWSQGQALTTHPRIAQAVRGLGFGIVHVCRPAWVEVLQSLNSWSGRMDLDAHLSPPHPKIGSTP